MGRKTLGWLIPEKIPGFRADFYDKLSEKISRMYKELADDITKKMKHGSILDVRTGPGHLPIEITKRSPKVKITGIDLTEKMIEIAKKKAENAGFIGRVYFEVGDGNKLRYEDNTFDLVVSSGSFHHWKNPVRVLNECYRVLKPEKEAWIYDFDKKEIYEVYNETRN
jgi:ubiquinone/menaquinone biosynthesis C-methylase UbiE